MEKAAGLALEDHQPVGGQRVGKRGAALRQHFEQAHCVWVCQRVVLGKDAFDAVVKSVGFGQGAEVRAPMAITVIGGLLVSTFLTLLVIPVVYSLIDRKRWPVAATDAAPLQEAGT